MKLLQSKKNTVPTISGQNELDTKLEEYKELQESVKKLNKQKAELKQSILEYLKEHNIDEYQGLKVVKTLKS